jgi:ABC-type multidrug transport system ATPase subunit
MHMRTRSAGKTTLISVLTGMERADAGRATINGLDVATDMSTIRTDLGEQLACVHDVK